MDNDWRAGIEAEIEAAAEPLWEIAEKVFEATGKLVHDAGAREEREAVVQWLRGRGWYNGPSALRDAADRIEAGEHRKEATNA